MPDSINAIDVSYQTEVSIENKSTEQLTIEANVQYKQAESLAAMSLTMLADVGRKITEIKNRIPHGEFEDWCADNLVFSKKQAERYMKLAAKIDDESSIFSKTSTLTDIGISRVWALLAAPEEVAAEVVENNNVADLTVRELREEISRLKREKKAAEEKAEIAGINSITESATQIVDLENSVMHLNDALQGAKERNKELLDLADQRADRLKEANDKLQKANSSIEGLKMQQTLNEKDLNKAKEALAKEKQKVKDLKAAQDEEVQKRLEEASIELTNKAKEEAFAESEAEIKKHLKNIDELETQIRKLKADNAKLSNTNITKFSVLCGELENTFEEIRKLIDAQNESDPDIGLKMVTGLQMIGKKWIP